MYWRRMTCLLFFFVVIVVLLNFCSGPFCKMHIVFLIESVSGRIKFTEKVAVCAKFVLKCLSCEEMVVSLH